VLQGRLRGSIGGGGEQRRLLRAMPWYCVTACPSVASRVVLLPE
jgi:hypothetical protein